MTPSPFLLHTFEQLAHQPEDVFSLGECALLISKALYPSADIQHGHSRLDELSKKLERSYVRFRETHPILKSKAFALRDVMYADEGFYGEEEAFDDIDQLNLFYVLEEKCASALVMSLIFVQCARTCGWSAHMLNFPGYHLIRLDEGCERVILDPYRQCAPLDTVELRQLLKVISGSDAELKPAFYEALDAKTLALRHINAIKMHFQRTLNLEKSLEILHYLTRLEPQSAAFWREKGLLESRFNQPKDAITSLQNALQWTHEEDTKRHTQNIINDIQRNIYLQKADI